MKAYWNSFALIAATEDADIRLRLSKEGGFSRLHGLAETFSARTGKPHLRLSGQDAAKLIEDLCLGLEFVDLSKAYILEAAKEAQRLGVRRGHFHDLLRAKAAIKSGAAPSSRRTGTISAICCLD